MPQFTKVRQFRGINNVLSPEALFISNRLEGTFSYLQKAKNVDITNDHTVAIRAGVTRLASGYFHSLWSDGQTCLVRKDDAILRINSDLSMETVRSGLVGNNRMAYLSINNRVYYSDGVTTGVIEPTGISRSWGMMPPGDFQVTPDIGDMKPGRYLIGLVYIREDGQESGCSNIQAINVTTGGITVSLPTPDDSGAKAIALFMSTTNGMVLYRAGLIPLGISSVTIRETPGAMAQVAELRTQGKTAPPAGTELALWKGSVFVAVGERLYYSEPWNYELFDLLHNYYVLEQPITLLCPMSDGLWVGTTTRILWLTGKSPDGLFVTVVADYGAIPGTLQQVDREVVGLKEDEGQAFVMFTRKGVCLAMNNGAFKNITQERYVMPPHIDYGCGLYREDRGIKRYIALARAFNRSTIVFELPAMTGYPSAAITVGYTELTFELPSMSATIQV